MPEVHPTAIVDAGAELADDVRIGAFAVIGPEVRLGPGVEVRPHALITGRTRIGARTRVFPFAVLGEEPQDKSFSDEPTELVIGADNVLREHVTIHVEEPFKHVLGVPDLVMIHHIIPLGWPAVEKKKGIRRPLEDVLHRDTYDMSKYMSNADIIDFLRDLRGVTMNRYQDKGPDKTS